MTSMDVATHHKMVIGLITETPFLIVIIVNVVIVLIKNKI